MDTIQAIWKSQGKPGPFHVRASGLLQPLSKLPRGDWLEAIVYKIADNKNDVRSNARAFSTEK